MLNYRWIAILCLWPMLLSCSNSTREEAKKQKVDFQEISKNELQKHFARDPELVDKITNYSKRFNGDHTLAGVILAKKGLKRLDDQLLYERSRILLKLSEFDSDLICAGLFTGEDPPGGLAGILPKLPKEMLLQWTAIQVEAMVVELNQKPFTPPTMEELSKAFIKLYEKMKSEDALKLRALLGKISVGAVLIPPSEGCWVTRNFFKFALEIDERSRSTLLRAIFTR